MFWRRSRNKETAVEETDDLVKLQKQFGIKPVNDADVQAEFQALFGAASSSSPTVESLLFGAGVDDEDEEEAKILRDLQIDGLTLDDSESEGHEDASHELRGVIQEAHTTAKQNFDREKAEMAGSAPIPSQSDGDAVPNQTALSLPSAKEAEVHALKLQALALKREGKIQEALAKFREAKQLQERYSTRTSNGSALTASGAASSVPKQEATQPNASLPMESIVDEEGVEVTDEDMQDPEFLAQLAKMGLADHDDQDDDNASRHERMQQLPAIEAEIKECKLQAVQFKRQNQIADALACMRKIKDLEAKKDELQSSPLLSSTLDESVSIETTRDGNQLTAKTSTVVHLNTSNAAQAVEHSESDDGSVTDVDVTPEDMNDPVLATELLALGDTNDSSTTMAQEKIASPQIVELKSSAGPPSVVLSRQQRPLRSAPSIDDDFLIDAFDEKSDSEEESSQLSSLAPYVAKNAAPSALETIDDVPPPEPIETKTEGSHISDLVVQLEKARHAALSLKRKGDIQGALESMRRAKQIQNLIDRKQQACSVAPAVDPTRIARFQEIERLLVEFGNRAIALAKESLPVNREKASEWLAKRKQYEVELNKLRQMRQNPLQNAPRYEIVKSSRPVEIELPLIPEDQIKVVIKSVNGLSQAAGRTVFVKFCLSFPSATPHEGQIDGIQIGSNAPFTVKIPSGQAEFNFKLPRSRGTMRLFEIKKATFEIWKSATLFRNPELVARAYQELNPLLTRCAISAHLPFLGSNRKPSGGEIEIAIQMRRPLKEKETRLETVEELVIDPYPEPVSPSQEHVPMPTVALKRTSDTHTSSSQDLKSQSVPDSSKANDESQLVSADLPLDDPHHVDLIVSYDVINEELGKLEAKLPSLTGAVATELTDRYDSLALKKQLLEIEMQTGKLTLDMYVERLHNRIRADRLLTAQLLKSNRRLAAARVLHRVKTMEKELVGTEGDSEQS
ncbi:hypothetical protein PHYBOEH_001955 [Phytophthora boehmeriae]|uniref:DM14 domain-containing protein n=1 Tax=Phytophthora boehmeriae TaxID=109152 RepID=A0A8T1WTZ7_9STRA|nr:hypothetical protein PHYBOEH_001955 [Phytophthora boehmeriae]